MSKPESVLISLPHSTEAERSALIRVILYEDIELVTILQPEDFYDPTYRQIFEACKKLIDENQHCNFVSLCDLLRTNKKIEDIGGAGFIAGLCSGFAAPAHTSVQILKKHRGAREELKMQRERNALVNDGKVDQIPSLLVEHSRKLAEFLPRDKTAGKQEMIDELITTEKTIPTGYVKMDHEVLPGGIGPGDLLLIAARPSVGKSALATNLTANFLREGIVPCFFSMEMSRKQVMMRILCAYYRLTPKEVIERASELINGIETDLELMIGINDLHMIQSEAMASPADVFIIDYFGLITMQSKDPRFQQMDEISRCIKNLAIHTEKPIIMLTQLNREIEKDKTNREPMLSDLFGGGEKDADVISFLWDPNAKDKDKQDAANAADVFSGKQGKELEWIVRKNRNGPPNVTTKLRFIQEMFLMEEEFENRPPAKSTKEPLPF